MVSTGERLLTPDEVGPVVEQLTGVLRELDGVLLGQPGLHRMVLVGILSRGHILLEGMPGVGKTAMIRTLGQLLTLDFNRVQFTPDLMPSDIVGSPILEEQDGQRQMVFKPGPVFTNILLADEINRASPKTQSAMLEAMQERCVTTMGQTRTLPSPFFVLASQNPIELEGTYPLPEAQVDRFLFKLNVPRPSAETMERIIDGRRRGQEPTPEGLVDAAGLEQLFAVMDRVVMPPAVSRYVANLVAATHADDPRAPELIKKYVTHGASPRAAIGMAEAARAVALLNGRPTAGFEDVDAVAEPVLNHRMILNYQARFDGVTPGDVVATLVESIDAVDAGLPRDIQVEAGA
ncbi:MAG: MoxR family ATPase [Planctomycetota bacterium]